MNKTVYSMFLFAVIGWVMLLILFLTGSRIISLLCLFSFTGGIACWFAFSIYYLLKSNQYKQRKVRMNVKQSYYSFLQKQGAKEKIQSLIRKGIDKWKQQQAYEYKPTVNKFGETLGEVNPIYGKTIGDICKTDVEVLLAYSGNSRVTFRLGHGIDFNNVAYEINMYIENELLILRDEWIKRHLQELLVEYDMKDYDKSWDDVDVYVRVSDKMRRNNIYNFIWMAEAFPEYLLDKDGKPSKNKQDLVFKIIG